MKQKRTHAEKQRLIAQIVCLILAALMILGVLMSILPYAALTAHAADTDAADTSAVTETEEAPTASDAVAEEEPDNGLLLRIGLMFGSGVTESFAVRADDGFSIHHVDSKTDESTPLWQTSEPYAAVCCDDNLKITDDGYYVPASEGVVIGGYHLELPTAYSDMESLAAAVTKTNTALMNAGIYSSLIYAFPSYKNGSLYVRIGDFGSGTSASDKAALIESATGEMPTVVNPMADAMTLIAPDKNLILFEYRAQNGHLGLLPLPDDDYDTENPDAQPEENKIVTPAKNSYRGTFLFGRYNTGISVTNLVTLEDYVAGVLPYEISNTWSYESQKAFACIIRSYTLANLDKHSSLGIDLCNGTDCQVYMGTKNENDAVRAAVSETRGLIITYNDKPCATVYSAVTGGCTVNVEQIWNGSTYPYLRAVQTPWEDYASHPNGVWLSEVSGAELYSYLSGTKGYTKLKGEIADVRIVQLAENSTYVYLLEITDRYGNSVTLKGTDIIRTTLGRYLKSANFVVGHNGTIPILEKILSVLTPVGTAAVSRTQNDGKTTTQVLTADGVRDIDITDGMEVLQADGSSVVFTDETAVYDIPADAQARLDADGNSNFLFIGKGWGHGGGISQWGAKNMAELGHTYEEIIFAYFTGVEIEHYSVIFETAVADGNEE